MTHLSAETRSVGDSKYVKFFGHLVAVFLVAAVAEYRHAGVGWIDLSRPTLEAAANAGIDALMAAILMWLSPLAKTVGIGSSRPD